MPVTPQVSTPPSPRVLKGSPKTASTFRFRELQISSLQRFSTAGGNDRRGSVCRRKGRVVSGESGQHATQWVAMHRWDGGRVRGVQTRRGDADVSDEGKPNDELRSELTNGVAVCESGMGKLDFDAGHEVVDSQRIREMLPDDVMPQAEVARLGSCSEQVRLTIGCTDSCERHCAYCRCVRWGMRSHNQIYSLSSVQAAISTRTKRGHGGGGPFRRVGRRDPGLGCQEGSRHRDDLRQIEVPGDVRDRTLVIHASLSCST